jgi:hypothetical protein
MNISRCIQTGFFYDGIDRYSLMPARSPDTATTVSPNDGDFATRLGAGLGAVVGGSETQTIDIGGTMHVVVKQSDVIEGDTDDLPAPQLR